MASYKISVNPNNQTNNQNANMQLIQQIAQNQANQAAQQQAQQQTQSQEQDPLRAIVNDMIKNKLVEEIQTPKFTTIQDIFNAPKGSKMSAFADYVTNNPDATRLLGSFLEGSYIDRHGNDVIGGERQALKQEIQMQEAQKRAIEMQQAQQNLANDMYKYYQQKDIEEAQNQLRRDLANQELDWAKQKFAQELALDRAKLGAQISHQRFLENMARNGGVSGSATGGATGISNLTDKQIKNLIKINGKDYIIPGMSTSDRGKVRDNNAVIKSLERGLKVVEQNKGAFGLKGGSPAVIQSIAGTKAGNQARSEIGSLAKEYKKYLTGVASNKTEEADFLRYVPAPFDNAKTLEAKIKAIKNIAEAKNDGILNTFYYEELPNLNVQNNNDPLRVGI